LNNDKEQSLQQFIDQGIFDCGVLVLAFVGVSERKKNGYKYDINQTMNHDGMLDGYQNLRPNDHLYRKQTKDALEWLIYSNLIEIEPDDFAAVLQIAAGVRLELNASMQPPSMKEKILRGAVFQAESVNYLERVSQAKINISSILNQISPMYKNISTGLPHFEKKLRSSTLEYFISQTTNDIKRHFEKKWRYPPNMKVDFHFSCRVAASCFWSSLKRFDNFPGYIPSVTPRMLTEEIILALSRLYSSIIDRRLINQYFELYLSDAIQTPDKLNINTEQDLWDSLPFHLNNTYLYADEDQEVMTFLEDVENELQSFNYDDAMDIGFSNIGCRFLNLS